MQIDSDSMYNFISCLLHSEYSFCGYAILFHVHAKLLQLCLILCITMDYIPLPSPSQALLSKGFFRQEYWSGLPCLSHPRDQTHISHGSCVAGRFFTAELLGKPIVSCTYNLFFILYCCVLYHWRYTWQFVYLSPANEYLNCFIFLACTDKASVNIHLQILVAEILFYYFFLGE